MSTIIIPKRRQERRNTAAALAALNEVLLAGEWCIETDTGKTKLGDGVTAWNSLRYLDTNLFAVASGTNTITATFASKPVLYDGLTLLVRAAAANTSTVTFNPNSLGASAMTKQGGTALAAGDIAAAGHELILRYRASVPRWELLNPAQGTGGGGGGASAGAQVNYAYTVSSTTASTTNTSIPIDATLPQITEGVAYSSLDTTITPTSATSLLEVEVDIPLIGSSTISNPRFALFRDSTANSIGSAFTTTIQTNQVGTLRMKAIVAAGSTSATTFKLRWSAASGTAEILMSGGVNYLAAVATMTVREIKQ